MGTHPQDSRYRLWKTVRVEWFSVPRYGNGEVRERRLYQLIRQKSPIKDRTFEIELLDTGVQAALGVTFG
jgi:hypothetical protein